MVLICLLITNLTLIAWAVILLQTQFYALLVHKTEGHLFYQHNPSLHNAIPSYNPLSHTITANFRLAGGGVGVEGGALGLQKWYGCAKYMMQLVTRILVKFIDDYNI